ncbi:MAG: hypothetical protein HYU78_08570 [Rhodocyclales bacterium]|nr:hypothetical protein [Rhodocyclales bacterium]
MLGAGAVVAVGLTAFVGDSWSARESNVRATKHNLSKDWYGGGADPRTVKATSETQVCVFCHTPHAATPAVTPLWNKQMSGATYSTYTSSSLDAQAIAGTLAQPGGSSKLCLSCHDGTLAVGNVNVLNGAGSTGTQGTQSIALSGTGGGGTMAPGSGTTTGFTRFLGTDLSNDHPISVTYNKLLTDRDGELRDATMNATDGTWEWVNAGTRIIGVRNHRTQGAAGQQQKPVLPLEKTGSDTDAGQVQCASCHDPHIRETDTTKGNQKFLRLNRFQETTPANAYSQDGDIICLACHNKNQGSGAWAYSAHANPLVATPTYTSTAATQREFPANLPVWKAACLNCHDTHSVPGSRRLLREGTDGVGTPKSGGSSAIEETCYQCHTNSAGSAITPVTTVPDIKTDFTTLSRRMPIASTTQPAGTEVHDIGGSFNDATFADCTGTTNKCGKDFLEARARLGLGNLTNRHAECTDCHNPHRVVKFKDFRGVNGSGVLSGTPDASGTHKHTDDANTTHSNVASGVLRGAWGVEPTYSSASFQSLPSSYSVKRGDPGASTDTTAAASYVTREYQICLKCHSDYGYSDNNTYPTGNRPTLGSFTGGTPSGTNNLTQYTNQAKEFQAPAAHKGQVTTSDSGAGSSWQNNNHRSWHPVMDSTGRTAAVRNAAASNWNYPWRNAVGTQTMYCSDCHGSGVASSTYSVIPAGGENGSPWGPHGSNNNFLLKGLWNNATGSGQQADGLCFKCHSYTLYATRGGGSSGFGGSKDPNLHSYHADKIGKMRCNWCHVAVPHGWKNKALLVNLNDVGAEGGQAAATQVRNNTTAAYNNGPYYMNAINKVRSFATSGNWSDTNCGSSGSPGNGQSGRSWMRDSNESCTNPP